MSAISKDTSISFIGIAGSQLALFICFGLIGREWGKEALGDFNLSLSLAIFLSIFVALRYELACIQNIEQEAYKALIHTISLSLATLPVIYLFLSTFTNFPPAIALLSGALLIQQAATLYLNTSRKYATISLIRILLATTFALALLICSYFEEKPNPFHVYTLSTFVFSTLLFCLIFKKKKENKLKLEFFKNNISFPKFSLLAAALNSALTNSLPIIIPLIFGSLSAGLFAAAQRFGFAPAALTIQTVSGIFRRNLLSSLDSKPCTTLMTYKSQAKFLIIASLGYFILGNIFFGPVIRTILGEGWDNAETFFHILSPLYSLHIIYGPLSQAFIVSGALRKDLMMQILIFLSALSPLALSYCLSFNITTTLALFSASSSLALIYGIWLTYKVLTERIRSLTHSSKRDS